MPGITIQTVRSGGGGGGGLGECEHDFVDPYSYMGTAPSGTATSLAAWDISRIEVFADGTTTITTATSVAWDDRLTETYT